MRSSNKATCSNWASPLHPTKKSQKVAVRAREPTSPRWGPSLFWGGHLGSDQRTPRSPRHRLSYSIPSTGKSSGTRTSESARGRSLRGRSYVVLRLRRPSGGAPIGLLLVHTWIRSSPECGTLAPRAYESPYVPLGRRRAEPASKHPQNLNPLGHVVESTCSNCVM
jgi:hypothetical protein